MGTGWFILSTFAARRCSTDGPAPSMPDAAVSGAPRRGPRNLPGDKGQGSCGVDTSIVKGGGEDVLRLGDRGTDPRDQRRAIQSLLPLRVAWSNPVRPTSNNPG